MWEWSYVNEKGKSGKIKLLDQLEECPKIGRGINHDTKKNIWYEYINMIKGGHFGPWYIFASLTNSSRAQMYIGFVVSSLPNKFIFYIFFALLRFPIKSLHFESSTYILLSSTQHKIFNFFSCSCNPIALEHKEGNILS